MTTWQTITTPDGPFTVLTADDGAVLASGWTPSLAAVVDRLPAFDRPADAVQAPTAAGEAVLAYYAGDLDAVGGVPVRQRATPFLEAGWAALRKLPAGRPITYTDLADSLGRPSAVRAAASVCAQNRVALFVPCHRVIARNGSVAGFAWGVDIKRSLLDRERRQAEPPTSRD